MGKIILSTTENPEYSKCLINVMIVLRGRVCRRMAVPTVRTFLIHTCDYGLALKKRIFHE